MSELDKIIIVIGTDAVKPILPGTIDTPQNRTAMSNGDFSKWVEPAAIAEVIAFLASDSARAINGAALPVYDSG